MMSPAQRLFLLYPWYALKRYFVRETTSRLIITGIFLVLIFGIALLLYGFTEVGLEYLGTNPEIQEAVRSYMFHVLPLVTGWLAIGTTMITSLSTFGKFSHRWIMITPAFRQLALSQLGLSILSSLWIFVVVIIPILGAVFSSFSAFLVALIYFTVFMVGAILTGVLLFVGLVMSLRSASYPVQKNLTATPYILSGILGILAILGGAFWQLISPQNFIAIFEQASVLSPLEQIQIVQANFALSPAHIVGEQVYILSLGGITSSVLQNMAILIGVVGIGLIGVARLLTRKYLYIWQILQEGTFTADNQETTKRTNSSYVAFQGKTHNTKLLMKKDLLLLWRDRKGATWMLILTALWAGLTVVIYRLRAEQLQKEGVLELPDVVYPIVLAIGLYFISALTLRFVFPTFSTERKVAWIIGVSPLSLYDVIKAKIGVFGGVFSVLGGVLVWSDLALLGLTGGPLIQYLAVFVGAIITFVSIALYMSLAFPNPYTNDAQKLSATLPGLVFTGIALGLSFGVSYLMHLSAGSILGVLGILCIEFLIVLWSFIQMRNRIKTFEYAGNVVA